MIRESRIINTTSILKMKNNWFSCLKISLAAALLLALIGIVSVSADNSLFNIEWGVFSSGGGRISAGDVQLDSSLGEPITGNSTGGEISLDSGTWTDILEQKSVFLPLIIR